MLLGDLPTLAKAIGYGEKSAYAWRRASSSRDAGDVPSLRVCRQLLAYSKEHSLGLEAEHLIFGASAAEVARVLELREAAPAKDAHVAAE